MIPDEKGVVMSRELFKFWWTVGINDIFGKAEAGVIKLCTQVDYAKSQQKMINYS